MTALLASALKSPARTAPVAPRVLVADADPGRADALATRCRAAGWEAVTAADTTSGVSLAARHLPHAIVLHATPASGTVVGALARLRGIPALRRVPVIVCGVDGDPDEAAALYAGGASLLLFDQTDSEGLFVELASWVAPHAVAQAGQQGGPWSGMSNGATANSGGLALAVA